MKKSLLSLALISMTGLAALQAEAADSSLTYSYCGEITAFTGVEANNVTLGEAIYVPAEVVASWNGGKISGLNIGFGYGNANQINVFISEDLNSNPVFTQEGKMESYSWNLVEFSNPVEVPANGFYIGYEITTKSVNDRPLAVDNIPNSYANGGYIGVNGNWENYSSQFGNVCLRVLVEGDNLPANDVFVMGSPKISSYVGQNQEFAVSAMVINNGVEPVQSLSASCLFNGETQQSDINCLLSPASIAPGEFGTVTFTGLVYDNKNEKIMVDVTVNSVNGGVDANPSDNLVSGSTTVLSQVFPRMFVVEEWTGNWCGYCPYGIVGMQYMRETYGDDRFIGIAIHGGSASEPMLTTSYNSFMQVYGNGGYPGSIINRNKDLTVPPFKETLESIYLDNQWEQTFANVEISDIDISAADEGKITVTSNTTFTLATGKSRYRMAYVLVEDHVGPYIQTNYYSGGAQGPLEGWDDKGRNVEWYYDEVARWIQSIENSLPTTIEEGVTYEYTCDLPINNVSRLGNCSVIALILNSTTGQIENAVKVDLPAEAGVDEISASGNVKVIAGKGELRVIGDYKEINVYTVSGTKVASSNGADRLPLEKGLYIYSVRNAEGTTVSGKILIQ